MRGGGGGRQRMETRPISGWSSRSRGGTRGVAANWPSGSATAVWRSFRAVDGFDIARGNKFSTYATWAIRNHLSRAMRRGWGQPRPARHRAHLSGVPEAADTRTDAGAEQRGAQERRERVVARLLGHLDERERRVIVGRFGSGARARRRVGSSVWSWGSRRSGCGRSSRAPGGSFGATPPSSSSCCRVPESGTPDSDEPYAVTTPYHDGPGPEGPPAACWRDPRPFSARHRGGGGAPGPGDLAPVEARAGPTEYGSRSWPESQPVKLRTRAERLNSRVPYSPPPSRSAGRSGRIMASASRRRNGHIQSSWSRTLVGSPSPRP